MIAYLIFLFLAIYLMRSFLRASALFQNLKPREPLVKPKPSQAPQASTQVLSSCTQCGTYFASHQGVNQAGQWFCSQNCVALFATKTK